MEKRTPPQVFMEIQKNIKKQQRKNDDHRCQRSFLETRMRATVTRASGLLSVILSCPNIRSDLLFALMTGTNWLYYYCGGEGGMRQMACYKSEHQDQIIRRQP